MLCKHEKIYSFFLKSPETISEMSAHLFEKTFSLLCRGVRGT